MRCILVELGGWLLYSLLVLSTPKAFPGKRMELSLTSWNEMPWQKQDFTDLKWQSLKRLKFWRHLFSIIAIIICFGFVHLSLAQSSRYHACNFWKLDTGASVVWKTNPSDGTFDSSAFPSGFVIVHSAKNPMKKKKTLFGISHKERVFKE